MSARTWPLDNDVHGPDVGSPALGSRGRQIREILVDLGRLPGVRGGIIVTPDGLVITADLGRTAAEDALAALAASLGNQLAASMHALGRGTFRTALFAAENGTLFVGGSPVGFVVLVATANTRPDTVLQALDTAAARLTGTWQTTRA
jgi:predicted regulator of Ras-like GTPase activity (Roadblock/LC7/MglB family)